MIFWSFFYTVVYTLSLLLYRNGLWFIWLLMAIVSGFRYKIGSDYLQYELVHIRILEDAYEAFVLIEPFHVLLTFLADVNGFGFQFVVFLYSILTIYTFYVGFRFYSRDKVVFLLATMLFLGLMYASSLNGIRQYLAAGIFLVSTRYIISRRFMMFVTFIFMAFLVHKSAILLLPTYFLYKRFNTNIVLLSIGIIFTFIFFLDIVNFDIPEAIILALNFIGIDYVIYLDYGVFSGAPPVYTFFITLLTIVFMAFISLFDRSRVEINLAYNLCIVLVVVKIIATQMQILGRFDLYFEAFLIIFLSNFIAIKTIPGIRLFDKSIMFTGVVLLGFLLANIQMYKITSVVDAYKQYAVNLSVFSDQLNIIQIFGDHQSVSRWSKD